MSSQLPKSRAAQILLAEDNDNDAELTRIGFQKAKFLFDLHHVRDGVECLSFLRKEAPYSTAPTPDIVLLDLNMPRMGGAEVMAAMLEEEALQAIPVVVMTTSEDEQEIVRMYKMRCSSYILKPVELQQFLRVTQSLANYWFDLVVLPTVRERK